MSNVVGQASGGIAVERWLLEYPVPRFGNGTLQAHVPVADATGTRREETSSPVKSGKAFHVERRSEKRREQRPIWRVAHREAPFGGAHPG